MPLTFPSHAAVLPLKHWRPRWFDGVALVIGSASPDLAYALDGSGWPVFPLSHQWPGVVLFCLPVTIAACVLVRWAAPVVAAHLPGRLTAYGVLGCRRPRLFITALSAMTGAASHLIWDRLAVGAFDLPSSIAGTALTLFLLIRYPPIPDRPGPGWASPPEPAHAHGQAEGLRRAGGEGRPEQRWPLFWPVAMAVSAVGVAVAMRLPGAFLFHTSGARLLIALAAGMLAGAACVKALRVRPSAAV